MVETIVALPARKASASDAMAPSSVHAQASDELARHSSGPGAPTAHAPAQGAPNTRAPARQAAASDAMAPGASSLLAPTAPAAFLQDPPASGPTVVPLPSGATEAVELTEAGLGLMLGALASRPGPVPKYRYPSAGTLYPVQTYVVLRRAFAALRAGSYYHDPVMHELIAVSSETPVAPDGSAPDALILLVGQRAAIAPIYAEQAMGFCLLEAGYMSEVLRAACDGLVLRDAGDPAGSPAFIVACALEADHVPLVCWAAGEKN
jgi:hypothetical protein